MSSSGIMVSEYMKEKNLDIYAEKWKLEDEENKIK